MCTVRFLEKYINIKKYDHSREFIMRRNILISMSLIISFVALSFGINAEEISSSDTRIHITTNENFRTVE